MLWPPLISSAWTNTSPDLHHSKRLLSAPASQPFAPQVDTLRRQQFLSPEQPNVCIRPLTEGQLSPETTFCRQSWAGAGRNKANNPSSSITQDSSETKVVWKIWVVPITQHEPVFQPGRDIFKTAPSTQPWHLLVVGHQPQPASKQSLQEPHRKISTLWKARKNIIRITCPNLTGFQISRRRTTF